MNVSAIRTRIERDLLLYVTFFTGAAVLAVEVMAVRVLAPYFGNTIYTFSSVLSVILAALSLGYWRGGTLADQQHDPIVFFRIVTRAGWAVIIMQIISTALLLLFAAQFSLLSGPLIASLVLFFYPSYLFGLLSPYVIKLRSDALPDRGIGTISGEVFFVSTMGSIVGSLLSGFVLVPFVGITFSLLGVGFLTVCIGILGMARLQHLRSPLSTTQKVTVVFTVLIALSVVAFGYRVHQTIVADGYRDTTVQLLADGLYERIAILDSSMYAGVPGRLLLLDRTFSSGVTLPEGDLLFPYTWYYKLYHAFSESLDRALVLGAGTGTVAKALHEDFPKATIDIVDIEPRLLEYASKYFFMPITPHIRGYVADGRQFLRIATTTYDFIFADMYAQLHAVPWHVSTKEYYRTLYDRMNDGGVYVANHIGTLRYDEPALFWSTVRTLSEQFGDVAIFAVQAPNTSEVQNIMLVARKQAPLDALEELEDSEDEELVEFSFHRVRYEPALLEHQTVFTDDLAPLELYAARTSAHRE